MIYDLMIRSKGKVIIIEKVSNLYFSRNCTNQVYARVCLEYLEFEMGLSFIYGYKYNDSNFPGNNLNKKKIFWTGTKQ